MSPQQHRIRRQVFELVTRDEPSAERLAPVLGQLQRDRLLPLIDSCLSEASSPSGLRRIERLEIDLGVIDAENFANEFVEQLALRLPAALGEHQRDEEARGGGQDREQQQRSDLELLDHYVTTGRLPWWATPSQRLPDQSVQNLLRSAPRALAVWLHELARLHPSRPEPIRRLVAAVGDPQLRASFALLVSESGTGPDTADIEELLQAARAMPDAAEETLRRAVWEVLLSAPGLGPVGAETVLWPTLLSRLSMRIGWSLPRLVEALARALPDRPSENESAAADERSPLRRLLRRALEQEHSPATASDLMRLGSHTKMQSDRERERRSATASIAPAASRAAASRKRESAEAPRSDDELAREIRDETFRLSSFSDADAAYIDNAGVVLLWPFLRQLFDQLELLTPDDGGNTPASARFRNEAARMRAIGVLHYLATGAQSAAEYAVSLEKVLCGMHPDQYFELDGPVSEREAEVCSELLGAAIAHASILNDMSHQGFRNSFLLRSGALSVEGDAWLLRVERQSWDVVLDRFPWTFDWVKLPWMEGTLRVEW